MVRRALIKYTRFSVNCLGWFIPELLCREDYLQIEVPMDFIHEFLSCQTIRVNGSALLKGPGLGAEALPELNPLINAWMKNRITFNDTSTKVAATF